MLLDGRLLLIKRGRPPAQGCWSVPGGRCHPGESPEQACVRELAEETGLRVEVVRLAGRVERDAPDGSVYVIDDFVCTIAGDAASRGGVGARWAVRAGDDADDARWFSRADLAAVELSPGLYACLDEWGVLPD